MPTYDYVCRGCGHELEVFHSITEPARRKCPKCGKQKLERRIGSGAGILFRGSGFYQTDYRSESYRQGQKTESGASKPTTDGAATSEKKADSKPETAEKSGAGPESKPQSDAPPKTASKSSAKRPSKPGGGAKKRDG